MINKLPIAEHNSWLALDPVWGCANDCGYCFLRDSGLTGTTPRLEFAPDARMRERLAAALRHCPEDVPVSIGNTTDLFLNEDSRGILYRTARLVSELEPKRLIVMITKAEITERIAKEAADAAGGNGLIFLSQSFAKEYDNRVERGHASSPKATYRSFEQIAKTEGLNAIHFWRPFLLRWNPPDQLSPRIRNLRNSGCLCSIVIGLKGGRRLISTYSPELRFWAEPELRLDELPGEERVSADRLLELTALARELDYPLYRHTSCGIALSQSLPDINGTSVSDRKRACCESMHCPQRQRSVCAQDPLPQLRGDRLNELLRRCAGGVRAAADGEILIPEKMDEFSYNHLIHVLHRAPCVKNLRPRLIWRDAVNDGGDRHDTI